MITQSGKYPKKVEIKKVKGNIVTLVLRNKINQKNETDSLTGDVILIYEYDEVKIETKQRPNLLFYIENNFDAWFERGKQLETLRKTIAIKEKEMNELIGEHKQIDINNELLVKDAALFDGLTETFEEVLYIDNASNAALEGLVEVYELLDQILKQNDKGAV